MITVWVFFITFILPSFGGPVVIRSELTDQRACERFRKVLLQQLEHLRSQAVVSECEKLVQ
jgi:hypothetical protein